MIDVEGLSVPLTTSIGIGDGSHDPKAWRELREEAITRGIEKKKSCTSHSAQKYD
jgi:hypothetical protein